MANPYLRVFGGLNGASESPRSHGPRPVKRMVTIPLAEVLPSLIDAVQNGRTWVRDFGDDEVTLSADLYEVLIAYQRALRPSA
jgi:hypothetical protein